MKQLKLKNNGNVANGRLSGAELEELRTQHRSRLETNRRVEQLKVNLLRITESNMDQTVRLLRRWLTEA
ncbi:MAG: flagellar M-ring protein FliF [Desulfovibrionaceae bacterium]|nr:flagellar M-ring protein FliF [Desulfovibrionaceae bacterium]